MRQPHPRLRPASELDPGPTSVVEVALRASESRFRALFEQSPVPMTTQRGGLVLDANRAALTLLRCDDPSELIGHPGAERIAPHALVALLAQAGDPQGLAPASYETVGVRFDGTEFPVLVQRLSRTGKTAWGCR